MSLVRQYIREVLEAMPQIQPESQIFCDMDGVLVNFEEAAINLVNNLLDGDRPSTVGVERSKGYEKRLRKVREQLGPQWRAKNRPDLDIKPVRNFMMGIIGANPGPVFAEMKPHMDALTSLWPYLTSSGHIINVLTAPIRASSEDVMSAEEGKELWVSRWLRPSPSAVIMSPAAQKVEYAIIAGVPNILIDDKLSTVEAWNAAGGIAVLHIPKQSGGTIKQLKDLGL